jgi:hypothetical protein
MILINFASRSRPAKFFACLDNVREQFILPYKVIAKLDTDDPAGVEAYDRLKDYPEVEVKWGKSQTKIHAINRDIPSDGWTILLNHSDDMWFTQFGADLEIVNQMPANMDAILHFPDGTTDLLTYSIMGREYYLRDGYVYHPDYISLWSDNHAMDVAKQRGKYIFVDMVIFEHRHPVWNKAEWDRQYHEQGSYYHQDKITYDRHKQNNFGL